MFRKWEHNQENKDKKYNQKVREAMDEYKKVVKKV